MPPPISEEDRDTLCAFLAPNGFPAWWAEVNLDAEQTFHWSTVVDRTAGHERLGHPDRTLRPNIACSALQLRARATGSGRTLYLRLPSYRIECAGRLSSVSLDKNQPAKSAPSKFDPDKFQIELAREELRTQVCQFRPMEA
jgi:hypothetical protein